MKPRHAEDTLEGTRALRIDNSVRLSVSPRSPTLRGIGLGMGLMGLVPIGVGIAIVSNPRYVGPDERIDESRMNTGVISLMTGAAITAVGWVLYGRSFRPSVDIEALPARAATMRFGFGFGPGSVSLGGSF